MKLGNLDIKLYIGSEEVSGIYLGENKVFGPSLSITEEVIFDNYAMYGTNRFRDLNSGSTDIISFEYINNLTINGLEGYGHSICEFSYDGTPTGKLSIGEGCVVKNAIINGGGNFECVVEGNLEVYGGSNISIAIKSKTTSNIDIRGGDNNLYILKGNNNIFNMNAGENSAIYILGDNNTINITGGGDCAFCINGSNSIINISGGRAQSLYLSGTLSNNYNNTTFNISGGNPYVEQWV